MLGPQPPFLNRASLQHLDDVCRRDPDGVWPQALEIIDDLLVLGDGLLPQGGESFIRNAAAAIADDFPHVTKEVLAALDYRMADWDSVERLP